MLKKTVFFDRDGTLIIDKVYLNDPEQIVYLPGVFEALAKLRDAGFQFVIVTNQSGVPRGLVSIENLNEIHRRIEAEFAKHDIHFAGIYYAPFSVESNHEMRKPNAGMLQEAAAKHHIDLPQSWIVGDRLTDAEAGHKAGCRSIFLEGYEPVTATSVQPTHTVPDILGAAQAIIRDDGL
jgi:D-glycero-D-manno-heptose 1,7-bisphosphate phosphatase